MRWRETRLSSSGRRQSNRELRLPSDRKTKANRENARASTGPKTYDGRARSAKNAFRHGLSLAVQLDEALRKDVDALASQIAGPYAGSRILTLARGVAEAQLDLRRVRKARHQLLSEIIKELSRDSRSVMTSAPQSFDDLGATLMKKSKQLNKLDRYERRSLSRCKFAIRALDAAHPPVFGGEKEA